jgi:hypothetical protein
MREKRNPAQPVNGNNLWSGGKRRGVTICVREARCGCTPVEALRNITHNMSTVKPKKLEKAA